MSTRALVLRRPGVSVRLHPRTAVVMATLVVAVLVVFVFNLGRGDFPISAPDVVSSLVGGGDEATRFIVIDLRLPRALVGIAAGIALGVSGALFQDMARNPLVAPDVIGITSGASLAAVSVIILADVSSAVPVSIAALGGAIVTGTALYVLAWRGGVHGYRLVLIGIGVNALMQAGIGYVLTRGRIFDVSEAYLWITGTLNSRGWEHVWPVAVAVGVLVPLALLLCRPLAPLQLGDDVGRALGVGVQRTNIGLLAIAVVLCGMAVFACGPIAFVAFVAPHIARRLVHTAGPATVMIAAGACGAVLLSGADLVGRTLFTGTEIPVGIITSIIAAPYFLLLLRRASRTGVTG